MNEFEDEYKDILIRLVKADVCFMIAGGFAVIYHGYVRTTGDLDIWLQPQNPNKEKLIPVLISKGFRADDINAIRDADFTKAFAFHYGELPQKVDFLTKLTGVDFEECFANADNFEMDGFSIHVIDYRHLLINKMLSGRSKDKADLDELQKIAEFKKNKKRK